MSFSFTLVSLSVSGELFEEMMVASDSADPLSSADRTILADMYKRVVTKAKDWRAFLDQHLRLLDAEITLGKKDNKTDRTYFVNFVSYFVHFVFSFTKVHHPRKTYLYAC